MRPKLISFGAVPAPGPGRLAWAPRYAEVSLAPGFTILPRPLEYVAPMKVTRVQKLRDLFWAKLVQSCFAGVVIILFGYVLYSENFVGTFMEMAKIFLWGFSLDVSVNTCLDLAKSTKKP